MKAVASSAEVTVKPSPSRRAATNGVFAIHAALRSGASRSVFSPTGGNFYFFSSKPILYLSIHELLFRIWNIRLQEKGEK
jgi:hypothetical protein